jgi:hypothetical protein
MYNEPLPEDLITDMILPGATLKYSKSFAAKGVIAAVAVTAGLLIDMWQSVVAYNLTYLT